jgi:hypothetical protein
MLDPFDLLNSITIIISAEEQNLNLQIPLLHSFSPSSSDFLPLTHIQTYYCVLIPPDTYSYVSYVRSQDSHQNAAVDRTVVLEGLSGVSLGSKQDHKTFRTEQ